MGSANGFGTVFCYRAAMVKGGRSGSHGGDGRTADFSAGLASTLVMVVDLGR